MATNSNSLEAMLHDAAPHLMQALIQKAMDGDVRALSLCMDRIYPVVRDRRLKLHLQRITGPKDLCTALDTLTQSMAEGDISPSEALTVTGTLKAMAEAFHAGDIAERLDAIEERLKP